MVKKAAKTPVRCVDCRHAYLRRPGNDPVLARCPFLSYCNPANHRHFCAHYEERQASPLVHPEPPTPTFAQQPKQSTR